MNARPVAVAAVAHLRSAQPRPRRKSRWSQPKAPVRFKPHLPRLPLPRHLKPLRLLPLRHLKWLLRLPPLWPLKQPLLLPLPPLKWLCPRPPRLRPLPPPKWQSRLWPLKLHPPLPPLKLLRRLPKRPRQQL